MTAPGTPVKCRPNSINEPYRANEPNPMSRVFRSGPAPRILLWQYRA